MLFGCALSSRDGFCAARPHAAHTDGVLISYAPAGAYIVLVLRRLGDATHSGAVHDVLTGYSVIFCVASFPFLCFYPIFFCEVALRYSPSRCSVDSQLWYVRPWLNGS